LLSFYNYLSVLYFKRFPKSITLKYTKLIGGTLTYLTCSIAAIFRYQNQTVRIQIDNHFDESMQITLAAICNGQYFGSGMHMAPDAKINDGLFDVILIRDFTRFEKLVKIAKLYDGSHIALPKVQFIQGKEVIVSPIADDNPIYIEADGETIGRLPARFEILPQALQLWF